MTEIEMVKGGRDPSVNAVLEDANGPIDLTGAQSVKFRMKNRTTGVLKVNGTCVIVGSPTLGQVRYDWGATDTDTIGVYDVNFEITKASGNKEYVPNNRAYYTAIVAPDLA